MEFYDSWIWLGFVIIGLIMVLAELILGVDTGLDLVFLGSAFIIGGLATWPFHSWWLTLIVTSVICVLYVVLGRQYVHRWTASKATVTNIDAIIGKTGTVLSDIRANDYGLVRLGGEEWRASAAEDIPAGSVVKVVEVQGVTLKVVKSEGG